MLGIIIVNGENVSPRTTLSNMIFEISHKKLKKFNLSLAGSFYQCNNHVTIIYYCIFIIFINFHYFEQFRLSFVLGPFEPSRNRCRNKKLNNRNSSFLRFHEPFVMHLVIMGSKNDSLFILICSWTIVSMITTDSKSCRDHANYRFYSLWIIGFDRLWFIVCES